MKNADDFRDELRVEFNRAGMTEVEGMNLLQGESSPTAISDNCVMVEDISGCDLAAAVKWMRIYNLTYPRILAALSKHYLKSEAINP